MEGHLEGEQPQFGDVLHSYEPLTELEDPQSILRDLFPKKNIHGKRSPLKKEMFAIKLEYCFGDVWC